MAKKTAQHKNLMMSGFPAQITKLVEGESHRGAVLILGAYLEELLGELVRGACVSDAAADDLLELRRPAGDFDSRIALCGALGLLHTAEVTGLQAIRKIRNSAAHFDRKGRGFDVLFDSDATISLVSNLAGSVNLILASRESEAVKDLFIISARLLATRIMFRTVVVQRPNVPPTLKESANDARERFKGTPQGDKLGEIETAILAGDFDKVSSFWKDLGDRLQSKVDLRSCNSEDS